ncbi:hypothetical protein AURDEDRAFT_113880 [Auricularia subglabra TFB-10046 SS5]|nr:hypothetical protein AURDEDRAFT_113880 [Auricularia subglabra TFB-10046 SS5]
MLAARRVVLASSAAARRGFTSSMQARLAEHYTKQEVAGGDVVTHHNGTQSYVVSTPPEHDRRFDRPAGAFQTYGTLAPETGPATDAPAARPHSSSSASPAHPTTTRQALDGTLADRNAPPSADVGRKGLGAWADRK